MGSERVLQKRQFRIPSQPTRRNGSYSASHDYTLRTHLTIVAWVAQTQSSRERSGEG